MADPLSIAAIIGIIYAGRKLGISAQEQVDTEQTRAVTNEPKEYNDDDSESRDLILNQLRQPGIIAEPVNKKQEVANFGDIAFSQYVHGEPTHDLSNRMYVSARMNNLAPSEKVYVGRGLGLDPEIPASGGFQQLYRVNPNNVGAYRLTQLPGRIAPGADTTGWRTGQVGELTHFAPAKTAFLPTRRPDVGTRAQGQGGAVTGTTIRESYVKTMRPTDRSETGLRTDGLEFAPAKRIVPFQESQDAPTRNKGDGNIEEFYHTNNPQPGIHSFVSGYTNEPAVKMMNKYGTGSYGYTDAELGKYGIKVDDKRSNPDRPGNAGRMNVRASPLNQGGMLTAVRSDSDKSDNYFGPMDGEKGYKYVDAMYYNFNAYKGNAACLDLNVAKRQLANNPLARSIA
jgi:hypothetical protein